MEKGEEEEISNDITVGFNLFIIFGNNKARKKKIHYHPNTNR